MKENNMRDPKKYVVESCGKNGKTHRTQVISENMESAKAQFQASSDKLVLRVWFMGR